MQKLYTKKRSFMLAIFMGSLLLSGCQKSEPAGNLETVAEPERYAHEVFTDIHTEKDIAYTEVKNYKGEEETLLLDIYTPANDTETNRPVIVWMHGGGFVGGSKDENTIVTSLAKDFAKKGYVSVNINYRTREKMNDISSALSDAMIDASEAIKWLSDNSQKYGIDKNNIVVGGYSAGAMVSINLCYSSLAMYGIEKDSLLGVIDLAGDCLYRGYVREEAPPCIIVQGTNDPKSAYEGSEQLAKMLDKQGINHVFYPIEGGGHDLSHKYEDISDQIAMFLYKELTGKDIVVDTAGETSIEYGKVEKRIAENPIYKAKQMELKVDGKLDEWADADVIALNQLKDVGNDIPEQQDFSGKVMIGWNENDPYRIYIAATVTDDFLENKKQQDKWYMNDCLEIAFDISKDNQAAPKFKCVIGADGKSLAELANKENTECQVTIEGDTYILEMAIDLTKVNGICEFDKEFAIHANDNIGVSLIYNDCENDEREHQIGWTPGSANDRVTFGNVIFQ